MSGETGIKVEKPTSVLQKQINVKPKELITSLSKAAINGAFLKWDDLAENGVEILSSLGLDSKPGEIAGLLIIRSLMQAMQNLLDENKELLVTKPDNLKDLYKQLNSTLKSEELVIDDDFFKRPTDLSIVKSAKNGFCNWLGTFTDKKIEAKSISNRLPTYFVNALNTQWITHNQDYAVIKEVLDTPFTQANKVEQGWLRYQAWLQKKIVEPMFLEAFSLKDVYVPLRGYYELEIDYSSKQRLDSSINDGKTYERIVIPLRNELEGWLHLANPDDAIRLISGGPGSGKSSFAKIFAAQVVEMELIRVLYIPLHLFNLKGDITKSVGEFVQVDGFLSHNPLDLNNGDSRLLIIFDGLDELSMQGKIAEQAAKEFVEEVRIKVREFNHDKTRCLQVLITGRELVVQANHSKFRKPQQILHILPYLIQEETKDGNYVDKQNLLKQDQRQIWWQYYGKAKGRRYNGLPKDLDKNNLLEITSQPLLNYLVALSFERSKIKFTEDSNLNVIYADLLDAVYERGYEKHGYRLIEGITKDEFLGVLEEIALACWHGDGRTTTVREIENHCDNSGMREILNRFQDSFNEDSKASITRLLTAFYFRESGGVRQSEKTFEFTHKSFGEYLAAKRIVQGLQLIHEDLEERKQNFRKGCDERTALVNWATLCGSSAMDEYLFRFICDEIRIIYVQNPSQIADWQKTLCRLIEFMLANGMPMEGLKERPNFYEEMRQSRNAEEAIIALLNACARVTQTISDIVWHSHEAFGSLISRLQGQRFGPKNILVFDCLSFLNLETCTLDIKDLYRANLAHTNLKNVELNLAILEWANLKGAILEGAILFRADLEEANLKGANLKEANLKEAILKGANLEGANLEGANLEGANLEGAILKGAILKGAILEQAILEQAILEPNFRNKTGDEIFPA
ncbi:pentapeptide repeat-containing protein [Nostoc sp. ChiSLP03a]|uniref:pentapeptide repeat-containing protein n=1 Tax=Nostoc sp. ChiSLP03a TaxID=3075380 RepID=UPI002AD54B0D|nr:pentapeptide repeat-containing protein [Nostoc sp. ChiSLP03a]MDZ8212116.1 pentapeptide repeat-containing protein [Nostoc sp. ChiSLP03a]